MAIAKGIESTLDLRPVIELVGYTQVLDQFGSDPAVCEAVFQWLMSHVTPEVRRKMAAILQPPDASVS
jgi:hypothetical protein